MQVESHDMVFPPQAGEVEELQAVLRIKEQLIQLLTVERDALEQRCRELARKHLELMERHEALRRELERMPSLEELVKLQTTIMSLEQQLKLLRSGSGERSVCDDGGAGCQTPPMDGDDKA